jgi:acyl-CoA reductase-like NAD-dependent aldehyde dehydrogenase
MSADPQAWRNRSPGDLSIFLPEVVSTDVDAAVQRTEGAFSNWKRQPLDTRIACLREAQASLRNQSETLAQSITLETGKPITEARGELGAVVAKIDLTIADAQRWIADETVSDGPHPAKIRHLPRGPAAVIAPFNFPIHLGHGAAASYLLAGNPVLFKPSPLAAATGKLYADVMQSALPPGVFELVQGATDVSRALCSHPRVRAICFTGSIPAGRAISQMLADDFSKSLALELGGKNASIVLDDAALDAAATAIADSVCLTTGQRCNATSRVLVSASVIDDFTSLLVERLRAYVPAHPGADACRLGPLISKAAVARYQRLTALVLGDWIIPGFVPESVDARQGNYVTPAALVCTDREAFAKSPLHQDESFCPIVSIMPVTDDADAIAWHNTTPFGLTASIFTDDESRFEAIGNELAVGNLYRNLPTTFSPSTLPFGGHGSSGNGKPGGRGFIRFAAEDQAVQWKADAPKT